MILDLEDEDPPPAPDTQDLLRRTRQGDRPARTELILYWMHRATRYTSGSWCRDLSEDERRDAQLKSVFEVIDKGSVTATTEDLDSLLLLTVRGKVSNTRRKNNQRKRLEQGFQEDAAEPVRMHSDAEEAARRPPAPPIRVVPVGTSWVNFGPNDPERHLTRRDVRKILDELPPDECEILILRFREGQPMARCQEIMELSEDRCRALLKRARQNFQQRFFERRFAWSRT